MSYYCEMCGKEINQRDVKKVVVEGSPLMICPSCYSKLSKRSTVVKEVARTPPKSSVKTNTAHFTSGSKRALTGKVEEYEIVEDYALRIKVAREKQGWSQEVLAQKIGESVNTIKRIEAGRLKPSIELARKLERALGVKLLEPVVEELDKGLLMKGKEEFLTIGDVVHVGGSSKRLDKGGN